MEAAMGDMASSGAPPLHSIASHGQPCAARLGLASWRASRPPPNVSKGTRETQPLRRRQAGELVSASTGRRERPH